MSQMIDDTICAPSTAPVNSSIAIIRISGPEAIRAASSIFSHPSRLKPRHAAYGSILDEKSVVDDVVMILYTAPASFTGEDMAEIFCHGNQIIVRKILKILFRTGLRLAEPGEFSKRGFLNGKMDLTEAEAINQIITARSDWEVGAAIRQMHGSLRDIITVLREKLLLLKANIEAAIDFSGEDIEFVSREQALDQSDEIRQKLDDLLLRCRTGEKISHGIDIAIIGKPNVGKSSLLNVILNQERAIVSDIPGTTRDIIREDVQIRGLHVNLIDTAGIDETTDHVEKIGIELSHKKIEQASVILMVIDSSTGIAEADNSIIEKLRNKKTIYILNKKDIAGDAAIESLKKQINGAAVPFCAKTGEGLKTLEDMIYSMFTNEYVDFQNSFVADTRVLMLIEKACETVKNIITIISAPEPPEIIAFEINSLIDILSEITGEITPDDVLNSIFSRFCIGK